MTGRPSGKSSPKLFTISVPASSANLGPGFDSIGLALSFSLKVDVYPDETWRLEPRSPELSGVPRDESSLVIRTALAAAREHGAVLHPCRLEAWSDIPLARGLGSSAAAIVAGLMLANELGGLGLPKEELACSAIRAEGHPDNPLAALFGGLVIAATGGGSEASGRGSAGGGSEVSGRGSAGGGSEASSPGRDGGGDGVGDSHSGEDGCGRVSFVLGHLPPCDIVVCIPDYPLETKRARAALPETLPFGRAVAASGQANVLVAALFAGDWEKAGEAMRGDLFHEPYREPLLPGLPRMRRLAYENGAYGAALSGAGPTVIAFAPTGSGPRLRDRFSETFPAFDARLATEDRDGARLIR